MVTASSCDQKRFSTVLGIDASPAADPDEQWSVVATAMLTHMRRWQQHQLSYGGRRHIQETYVWSRAWFLGAFRPPRLQLCHTNVVSEPDASGAISCWRDELGGDLLPRYHTRGGGSVD